MNHNYYQRIYPLLPVSVTNPKRKSRAAFTWPIRCHFRQPGYLSGTR